MPETENPKTREPRQKPAAKKTKETPPCHIHDTVYDWEEKSIRENVCFNDEPPTEFEGKYYCHFHLPDKKKNVNGKFDEKFSERLKAIETKIAAAEELPENERKLAIRKSGYDFSYVWFPSEINFINYEFKTAADFSMATFTESADFFSATFTESADFSRATFTKSADFSSATFTKSVDFRRATFTESADFSLATFTESADFSLATFTESAKFNSVIFTESANFNSATFTKSANFFLATFTKSADFRSITAEGYLQFSYLKQGTECAFDFQEAAFEKATRVSFHTVRLCPGWFVNVDSRKFVFTDIDWRNLEYERGNKNIERELAALEKRIITEQRKRLLEIAARQLAVNAEENNRYEEAAKFRYLAMETKRLEKSKFFSKALVTLYKWTSGYGERWGRAALMLLIILLGFGVFYDSPFANFEPLEKKTVNISADNVPPPPEYYKMNNAEGFVYSLYVAALQRPEPKAADVLTRFFVILETIFAPLQAALLALAIRRKFMR